MKTGYSTKLVHFLLRATLLAVGIVGITSGSGNLEAAVPPPAITSFSPLAAQGGTTVQLVGTNFSLVASNNIVYFGAVRAVVTAASATTLTVVVPAGATYGPPTVSVGGLTGSAGQSFMPTFAGGAMITATNFAPRVNLASGGGPIGTVIADLDGDGKPDLAVADGTGHTVSVYLNISTTGTLTAGSFGPRSTLACPTNSVNSPYFLISADVDGDGKLDLVTADFAANSVSVFRNTSTLGSLAFSPRVSVPVGDGPSELAVRDLDGDGRPDIIVANYTSGSVSILMNIGSPGLISSNSFAARIDLTSGSGTEGLTVADLDGDGKPDIAAANTGANTLSIFRNISTPGTLTPGSFESAVTLTGPAYPISVRAADLDGDGKPDLIVSSYTGQTLSVYRNLATGGTLTTNSFATRTDFALGARGHTISLGDLNGDGKPDVVVDCEIPSRICIFQNLATIGSFTSQSFAPRVDLASGNNAWGSSIGDLDGDGRPDIVFANASDNTVSFYQNLATILAMPPPPIITSFSPVAGQVGTAVQLVGANFSSIAASNIVYFGAVRAVVTAASATTLTVVVPTGAKFAPPTVTVGGLTGSARQSFIPTFAGGAMIAATNFGSIVNMGSGANPEGTLIADLDGDGKPDLVVADSGTHTVSLFRNISTNGTLTAGSFGPRVALAGIPGGTPCPYMMVAADVDGDGKLDLVTVDFSTNTVSVFRNTSTSGNLTTNSFAPRVSFIVGAIPHDIAVTDLDGDGRPEIVTVNASDSSVSILKNLSSPGSITSNSFAARFDLPTGSGPGGVAIVDLNGDGKPDIATANGSSATVAVFQNNSTPGVLTVGSFLAPVILAGPTEPHFIRAADLDGDGKPDLIMSTYNGQSLSVYRNLATGGTLTTNSFATRVDFALGARGHTISIGDLNGDGKPDVIVDCEIPSRICIFQNLATTGSFTSQSFAPRVDLATGNNAWGSSVGDLDGDGRPEIVFANYGDNTISFYKNLAITGPQFIQQPSSQTVYVGNSATFAVAVGGGTPLTYQWMVNGTNLAGGTNATLTLSNIQPYQAGNYSVLVSNALGMILSSNAVLTVSSVPANVPAITSFTPASGLAGSLLTISGYNFSPIGTNNIIYFGAVRAVVTAASATSLKVLVPAGATYAPITVTIAGLTGAATVPFLPTFFGGSPIGSTNFFPRLDLSAGDGAQVVRIADLNGDGKPDLAVNNIYGMTANVFDNQFSSGPITTNCFPVTATLPAPSQTYYTRVADVDGDGKPDLLVANLQSNSISVFLNMSSEGTLDASAFSQRIDIPVGLLADSIAVGDLDLDGKPDIIVVNQTSSTISIFRNLSTPGALTLAPKVDLTVGNTPHDVGVADLDGDGRPEIVTANFGAASISILKNLTAPGVIASNSFAARVDLSVPSQPRILAFGDVDGDGNLDLVVACYGGGVVSILRNLGTGSVSSSGFAAPVNLSVNGPCNAVALGDLNGDGKPDIAAVTDSNSHLSIFRNISNPGSLTTASFSARLDLATGANPQGICIGDLNADGRPEIVFANANNDTISIYENQTPINLAITQQPVSQSVVAGANANFSVSAIGTSPLGYRWLKGGVPMVDAGNVSGSTSSNLTLSTAAAGDAASYAVVVTNAYGSITSSVVSLTVLYPPSIVTQPMDTVVMNGSNAMFGVQASGTGVLAYQWYFNGTTIPDATNNNYYLTAVATNHAGNYAVVITNAYGSVTSSVASLTVVFPPSIVSQPASQVVINGQNSTFGVVVGGTGPLAYQWYFNGAPLSDSGNVSGSTSNMLAVTAVTTNNAGSYSVVVANAYGSVTSSVVSLTVVFTPSLVTPPASQIVVNGSNALFGVTASGTAPLSYQWYFNGAPLSDAGNVSGSTSNVLALTAVTTNNAGNYSVAVANAYGSVTSSVVSLTVVFPPFIVTPPASQLVLKGSNTTFSVVAGGTETLSYQWLFNGNAVSGATNTSYSLTAVTTNNNGNYTVAVTNLYGCVTSSPATLTVCGVFAYRTNNYTPALNTLTGLYEEKVAVTNIGGPVSALRLLVGGLPSRVSLYNVAGTNNGLPYAQFAVYMNPGDIRTFLLQFSNPYRLKFTNTVEVVGLPAPPAVTNNTPGIAISKVVIDGSIPGSPRFTIAFGSTPGRSYQVLYSDDSLNTWTEVDTITAGSNWTIWTELLPPAETARFFKIINLP